MTLKIYERVLMVVQESNIKDVFVEFLIHYET